VQPDGALQGANSLGETAPGQRHQEEPMYGRELVPQDFDVPERLDGPGYHLRMLCVGDLDKDYEAVTASAARLRGLLDPQSRWPDGLTRQEDLIDLAWHQREFTIRHSFAYTVMENDESRCLGCVYIFPSDRRGYDAKVFYWVRDGADAESRDAELGTLVRGWIATHWPFKAVAYPGRDETWDAWQALPLKEWV
jgi:hypothetical protein